MRDERATKIIYALLELGSFGPVDAVEDAHEQAEKYLDEHSPGWRDRDDALHEACELLRKLSVIVNEVTETIEEETHVYCARDFIEKWERKEAPK